MNEELKIIIKAVNDSAKKGIKEVKGELDKLSKSSKEGSSKIGAMFKGIGKGALVAVGAIVAVGAALVTLGKNTLQAQREQAKLISTFQASGSTAKQATETYKNLYRFLGDSGKATEAASHLAQITTSQKELAEWSKIAQGVYTTFGDSLPIESFTEAANETIKVGKVTGSMADAVNWLGVSEDALNAKLANTTSIEEREALVRSTLNDLYNEAAETYERNNKALLDYNESQANLDSAMASAGAVITPLLTALNNLASAFFTALKPALDAIIPPIASFINMIAQAIQSVMSFFSALTGKSSSVKAVADVGKGLTQAASGAKSLGSGLSGAEKSAEGAAKAVEEAKKSTQGFDELNIVSSGKSSSGGGGGGSSGGGGGSSSGLIDSASFATEVEETQATTNTLAENIKKTFEGLKDVFAPSISAWSSAFDTVKQAWNNAKPDFINGAVEIKEGFTTLGGYLFSEFVPNVVNSFSTNLAPVVGDTLGFVIEEAGKQFSWFGEFTNQVINDVAIPALQTIETVATDVFSIVGNAWSEHGDTLLTAFSGTFEAIRGHLDNFYNSVFKPIWDNIVAVFTWVWDEGLKPFVDKFINGVMVIATELSIFYNEVLAPIIDWIINNILPPIVTVINTIIDIVGGVIKAIANILGGVIDVIKGLIQFIVGIFTGDWSKAWEGIKNVFSGIWDIIVGLLEGLWEILKGIVEFVGDVLAAVFEIAWEAIKAVWSVVVGFFKGIWDGICYVFSAVGSWFADIFSGAWEGIKSAWSSVTGWFSNLWNSITGIFGKVGTFFKDKFTEAWKAIKNIFSNIGSFFSGIWDKIKNTFSALGTKIGNAISGAVKTGINGIIGMIEKVINSAIGLINGAIKLINKIPGVNIGTISKMSLPKLAKGGVVESATVAMIGEAGKEAVLPLENNTQWMDKLADRIATRNSAPSKIVLMVDGKELGWANIHSINNITKETGNLQLQLV